MRNEKNLTIEEAARQMGVTPQFVRVGIQQGILPFGAAIRITGKRYSYYISPARFAEYIGTGKGA